MKFCKWCSQTKRIEEFYAHPQMLDGHLNKCKACVLEYARAKRLTDDGVRENDRRRYRSKPNKRASMAAYQAKNLERRKAVAMIGQQARRAVQKGLISKAAACEECGASGPLEGAHIDYARPLDVRWLCRRCHRRWDAQEPKSKTLVAPF